MVEADKLGEADPLYVYKLLRIWLASSDKGRHLWSFANGTITVIIVTFSATAAVLAQSNYTLFYLRQIPCNLSTIASALSVMVTIASTIQTKMGFERKWAANRATQSALQQLRIDEAAGRSKAEIETELKRIISTHDQSIIGANT